MLRYAAALMNKPDNKVAKVRLYAPAVAADESPFVSAWLLNKHGGCVQAIHCGSVLLISPHVVDDQLHRLTGVELRRSRIRKVLVSCNVR